MKISISSEVAGASIYVLRGYPLLCSKKILHLIPSAKFTMPLKADLATSGYQRTIEQSN